MTCFMRFPPFSVLCLPIRLLALAIGVLLIPLAPVPAQSSVSVELPVVGASIPYPGYGVLVSGRSYQARRPIGTVTPARAASQGSQSDSSAIGVRGRFVVHEAETLEEEDQLLKADFSFAASLFVASAEVESQRSRTRQRRAEGRRVYLSWECDEVSYLPQGIQLEDKVREYLDETEKKAKIAKSPEERTLLRQSIEDVIGSHCVVGVIHGVRINIVAAMNSESASECDAARACIKANVSFLGEMSLTDTRTEEMSRKCRVASVSISSFVAAGRVYSATEKASLSGDLVSAASGLNSLDGIRDFQRGLKQGTVAIEPGPMSVAALPLAAVLPPGEYSAIQALFRDQQKPKPQSDPAYHTFTAEDIFLTQEAALREGNLSGTQGLQLTAGFLQGNSATNNAKIVLGIDLHRSGSFAVYADYENQWSRSLVLRVNDQPIQATWPNTGPMFSYRKVCDNLSLATGSNTIELQTAGWPDTPGPDKVMLHLRGIRFERLPDDSNGSK